MWLFLPFGFYSIVDKAPTTTKNLSLYTKGNDPVPFVYLSTEYLCIRSRDQKSLINLTDKLNGLKTQGGRFPPIAFYTDIIDNQGSDYQYRMWVHRVTFQTFMSQYLGEIDFNNFKNKADYDYKTVFGRVWSVLWDLVKSTRKDQRQMQLFDDEEYYLEEEIDIFSNDVTDAERDDFWDKWGK